MCEPPDAVHAEEPEDVPVSYTHLIAIIVVIVKRLRLTKQSEQLSAKIGRIPSYESAITNDGRKEAVYALSLKRLVSVPETAFVHCRLTRVNKSAHYGEQLRSL